MIPPIGESSWIFSPALSNCVPPAIPVPYSPRIVPLKLLYRNSNACWLLTITAYCPGANESLPKVKSIPLLNRRPPSGKVLVVEMFLISTNSKSLALDMNGCASSVGVGSEGLYISSVIRMFGARSM